MSPGSPRPRDPVVETVAERRLRRLNAFPLPYRKYIAGLTSCAPAVEDLADSFPALLFALATGYGTVRKRQAAFEAVASGQPLRDAATVLELPLWLRRLPPQAFTQPLPNLPADDEFVTTALNRVPEDAQEARVWFERVLVAYRLVGRDLALWVIREPRLMPPHTTDEDLQWLLAWAWASQAHDFTGHALLRGVWSATVGWKRARDEVAIWKKRIDLVGALAGGPRDPWFADAKSNGFEIVALQSVADYVAESAAMENCLDQYAAHLAYGRVRIFSVRKAGRPVADVEVTLKSNESATPCLSQIRGPRNRRAPPAVWQAVHSWIAAQPFRAVDTAPTPAQATREAFRRFWKPYVEVAEAAGLPPTLLSRFLGRGGRRSQVAGEAGVAVARPRVTARPTPQEDVVRPAVTDCQGEQMPTRRRRRPAFDLELDLMPARRQRLGAR